MGRLLLPDRALRWGLNRPLAAGDVWVGMRWIRRGFYRFDGDDWYFVRY